MAQFEYKAFVQNTDRVIADASTETDLMQRLEDQLWDGPFSVSTVELLDQTDMPGSKIEYIHKGVDDERRDYESLEAYKKYLYDSGATVTQWHHVHDPKGNIDIEASFADVVGLYDPNEVQELIYANGLVNAVSTINKQSQWQRDTFALSLVNRNKLQKVLVDAKVSHLH